MGDIKNHIDADHYLCYADDSYVVLEGTSLDNLKKRIEKTSYKHVTYLRQLGMKVNEIKSKVVIFCKKDHIKASVSGAGININTKNEMAVLGMIFGENLCWDSHARC